MDVRNVIIWSLGAVIIIQSVACGYIFVAQRKLIKRAQAAVIMAGKVIEHLNARLESMGDEQNAMQPIRNGQIAIGLQHDGSKYRAIVRYSNGETFYGPVRDTEEEAMADVIAKKEEVAKTLGNRVRLIYGPGVGPVH